ncbi:hypothetical protein T484DRAFT_1872364, partial [Baffinella frigidus]
HLSGLREIHFGIALEGVPHICRFVESFEEAAVCVEWVCQTHFVASSKASRRYP